MSRLVAPLTILALLAIWQLVCSAGLVPPFMLPSPIRVVQALVGDWPLLIGHAATSLAEAGLGLAAGVALGFIAALAMDRFDLLYRAFYPIVVLTQTIPTVAIAPLLVRWLCSRACVPSTPTRLTSCAPWAPRACRFCVT